MSSARRTKPTRLSRPVTNGLQGGALLITIGAASATPTRAKHVSQPQTRIQTHRRITHETATLADSSRTTIGIPPVGCTMAC
jgi:hypothetical protein